MIYPFVFKFKFEFGPVGLIIILFWFVALCPAIILSIYLNSPVWKALILLLNSLLTTSILLLK